MNGSVQIRTGTLDYRIVSGLVALPAAVDARKRLQAESRRGLHTLSDALLPANLDRAFKGGL
jgi:hypothetical protein